MGFVTNDASSYRIFRNKVEHLNFIMDVRIVAATVKNVLAAKDVNVTHQSGQGLLNEYREKTHGSTSEDLCD